MRRILALVLTMLLFATTAFATETDLTTMSIQELQELRSDVEAELIARGASDKNFIYEGTYVVGQDIKEGAYVLSFYGFQDYLTAYLTIFPDINEYEKWKSGRYDENIQSNLFEIRKGKELFFKFEEGSVLVLDDTCSIRPAENEIWRP